MTEKELRKLSRRDLLELLIEQGKEVRELRQKLAEAEAALAERTLAVENAGSLAEAALRLNGVFEAAQAACDQYLFNIRQRAGGEPPVPPPADRETQEDA